MWNSVSWEILEVVVRICLDRLHEIFRNGDRNVEIGDLPALLFAVDKLQDVRMIHLENAHIRAAARSSLFDGLRRGVKHLHKADRPGRHAAGRIDRAALCAQPRKREARSAAAFMNERRLFDGLKNRLHRILNREDKARRKLSQRTPGVHQRR